MKPISILVADDEQEIADLIAIHLEKENYRILKVHDGEAALDIIQSQSIDLVILDIMMPKLDGLEVTKQIREHYQMPIIFLSAKTSDFDKISGLIIGGDDYITKPFNPMELVARVKAQLRRSIEFNHSKEINQAHIQLNGLEIYPAHRKVILYGQEIELTPKEFDILTLLASYPKKVFSVENIFQHVWGEAFLEGTNTVMVHIRTLRKKLGEADRKNKLIKTVWGVGYTFNG